MISRSSLVALVFALVIFAASAYVGFLYHRSYAAQQVLAQPGWCCSATTRTCGVSSGYAQCRAGGGTVFNWDQSACDAVCNATKLKTTTQAPVPAQPSPAAPTAAGAQK